MSTNSVSNQIESVAVIIPPVVCHNLDPHTGIPFMPHIAAHLTSVLVRGGYKVKVFDCFGLNSNRRRVSGEFMLMGVDEEWVVSRLSDQISICFIYCRTIAEFISVERFIELLKSNRPDIKICLFENVHAVTSYSLRHIADRFLSNGADCIIMGDPEDRVTEIARRLEKSQKLSGLDGIAYRDSGNDIIVPVGDSRIILDSLPFPEWESFPLEGYWSAGFAHGPCKRGERFLPILTSRGCPYRCTFCIAPEVNPNWNARAASNVVDEMEHFYKSLSVTDFHVSDLNPTVSEKRTQEICLEIINRRLPITWKLAQGTKIETIRHEETLELMARAGCKFISFSPESGSKRLLKIMNKPFDHEHGLRMTRKMNSLGIRTQAVFIGGVPGENPEDRRQSVLYAKELIKGGVDEISLVIFTPLPGAKLSSVMNDFVHLSQCTPSPSWRKDYSTIKAYRYRMYFTLFSYKIRHYPRKCIRELSSLLTGRFETKMEMSLFKQIKLYIMRYFPVFLRHVDVEK